MSGICGAFDSTGGAVDPESLQATCDTFQQWFNDGHGLWCEGAVGLGHVMLWNTPESRSEHLPVCAGRAGQRLVITADVRLDNRAELAASLGIDTPLGQVTDSQLLLAAYEKWGELSPRYLLGDFAYAIWDEQQRQLFCARDHVGVKQLYYSCTGGLFVFANDVGALLASGLVAEELNEEAISVYLNSSQYIDQEKSFYQSIQKLAPASTITVADGSAAVSVYWRPEDSPPLRFDRFEAYVSHLRELLEDTVRVRLRTDYPLTSHLSGGLDSSAITVLATRMLTAYGKAPRVFNWSYGPASGQDPDCLEWSLANRVAGQENLHIQHISISPAEVKDIYLGANISLYEDSLFWEEASERALTAAQGGRTILSGWGGDELISYGGFSYYSGLIRRGKFLRALFSMYRNGRCKNRGLLHIAKRYIWQVLYAFFHKTMAGPYRLEANEDLLEVVTRKFAPLAKSASPPVMKFRSVSHGEQAAMFNYGHLQARIETWGAAALRAGVEYRYPLLDKRMVEFALGIPEEIFEPRNGEARFLFRSAISNLLPSEVAWAPKYDTRMHEIERIRLLLAALRLLLEEEPGLFAGEGEHIDGRSLGQVLEQVVQHDPADGDGIRYLGMVGPAVSIAVLDAARKKRWPGHDPDHDTGT